MVNWDDNDDDSSIARLNEKLNFNNSCGLAPYTIRKREPVVVVSNSSKKLVVFELCIQVL